MVSVELDDKLAQMAERVVLYARFRYGVQLDLRDFVNASVADYIGDILNGRETALLWFTPSDSGQYAQDEYSKKLNDLLMQYEE